MLDLMQAQPQPQPKSQPMTTPPGGPAPVGGKPKDGRPGGENAFGQLVSAEATPAAEAAIEIVEEGAKAALLQAEAHAALVAESQAGVDTVDAVVPMPFFIAGAITPEGLAPGEVDGAAARLVAPVPTNETASTARPSIGIAPAGQATVTAGPSATAINPQPAATLAASPVIDPDGAPVQTVSTVTAGDPAGAPLASPVGDGVADDAATLAVQSLRGQAQNEAPRQAASSTQSQPQADTPTLADAKPVAATIGTAAVTAMAKAAVATNATTKTVDPAQLGADAQEVETDIRPDRTQGQEVARAGNERAQMDRVSLGRMFAPAGATPLRDFAMQVTRRISGGASTFQIRLDPPELGKVDVTLEMKGDKATVRLTVERAETLELLSRDAKALEKALSEAGVRADAGDMQFQLGREGADDRDAERRDTGGLHRFAQEHSGPEQARAYGAVRSDALLDLFV